MVNEMKSLTLNGVKYDSFLDEHVRKELEQKQPKGSYVKTVNGASPDENGNVQIEIPESEQVAVLYTAQKLTPEQQAQARENIGAVNEDYVEKAIADAVGGVNLDEYQLLGVSPQYISGAENRYNIVVDATEATTVTISSDTVADLSTATKVSYRNATETHENGIYELTCTADGAAWYEVNKAITVDNLTPGEKYRLMYDATGVYGSDLPNYANMQISILDADGKSLHSLQYKPGNTLRQIDFTATTSTVTIYIYPSHAPASGVATRYRDIWVNKDSTLERRTEIYHRTFSVDGQIVLEDIGGGVTIESTPITNIYTQLIEGDVPDGPLAGKLCVCFGDSITGNYNSPFDYPSIIAKKTGMTVINGGFGGCRMAQHPSSEYTAFSMYSLANSLASGDWSVQDAAIDSVGSANAAEHLESLKVVDWSAVDFVTIFYGTNDFTGGVPIGEDENSLSTSQYKGAMRHSIETILAAYPKIRIVLLTPIYRFWTEDGTVTDSDSKEISGLKLTDYVKAVLDVAEEYKLPVFNLYNSLGINKINRTAFLADGVHPSEAGLERIADSISARMIAI